MRCRCGSDMTHRVTQGATGIERHEFKCPTCRREVIRFGAEKETRVKVQAGAGKKVLPWY